MLAAAAAAWLAGEQAGCAVIAEPAGGDFAVRLARQIGAMRVFGYPQTSEGIATWLGDEDADQAAPGQRLWPGDGRPRRGRCRRVDTLHDGAAVGLLAVHHDGAAAVLRGAAATLARCRPAVLLDWRGLPEEAVNSAMALLGPWLPGYRPEPAGRLAAWALPPQRAAPAPGPFEDGTPAVVPFDDALVCEGLHAPEYDAPAGGRWTGAGPRIGFWMPRPESGRWMLHLAVAEWGNAGAGFPALADGQRLTPRPPGPGGLVYGPLAADGAGGPGMLIELFPPRPIADHERWPRKIGLRILSASWRAAAAARLSGPKRSP